MACSACSTTISNAIKAIDTTAQVTADPTTKLVQVETQASETQVKQAVTNAGYTVA
ncbi:MAG TPA: heavy metal-associated domain-containing protein [Leptolyngbya sp.]|nr:heavy metal-associated domain-containing protein [Leptolyngbya sp.]